MTVITQMLTPTTVNGKKIKPGASMKIAGVTIHNTGNVNANAQQHAKAQAAGNLNLVAVHYYVDDKTIYQCLSDTEQGWHAGDGAGSGNTTTIAIEICEHKGINQTAANQNGAELAAHLLKKYGLSITKLYKHQDFTGKYCPHLIIPIWSQFRDMVSSFMNGTASQTGGVPWMKETPAYGSVQVTVSYKIKSSVDGPVVGYTKAGDVHAYTAFAGDVDGDPWVKISSGWISAAPNLSKPVNLQAKINAAVAALQ